MSHPPATPRWVKVFALVAALLIVLVVVLLVTGGHGPRRHGMDARGLEATAQTR